MLFCALTLPVNSNGETFFLVFLSLSLSLSLSLCFFFFYSFMAIHEAHDQPSLASSSKLAIFPDNNIEQKMDQKSPNKEFDYSGRSQWLRAAVLGANDGLVTTASLMMGVGAIKQDTKVMILTGFAGLVAGAGSMAIGELVSVYSQYDIEVAQMKRDERRDGDWSSEKRERERKRLPKPVQAAAASGVAFASGAVVPLLSASFIRDYKVRVGVLVGASSLALLVFGGVGAMLGKSPMVKSSARVLIGGLLAMGITFGLTKLIGSSSGL